MFICALRPTGEPLARSDVFTYFSRPERRTGEPVHTLMERQFAAGVAAGGAQQRPQLARWRNLVGVGDVRLDNRAEVARLAGIPPAAEVSDLEVVLGALDVAGEACVRALLGDFAFVAWDARAQKLVAARDAFGVKQLYQRACGELVLFASSPGALRTEAAYDVDYIRDYLVGFGAPGERTIWRDVTSVPAGGLVRYRGTVRTQERFWRAADIAPADGGDEVENCHHFRALLEEGVRCRLAGAGEVWAQLSGGLDSSTVVALANVVRPPNGRLAGTITVVDSLGEGDERMFSDAVVRRYQLRNEQVRDYWAWQDDGDAPPLSEQPTPMYPFYARDRRLWNTVRQAGGRVLLSGLGADHYLHGSLDYITDMAAGRRWTEAVREITSWAIETRQSAWRLGRRYLLQPFLPTALRPAPEPPPQWLRPGAGAVAAAGRTPRRRPHFADRIAAGLEALPSWIERWPFGDEIEMRYPFLYRPLVELSLRLPPRHRIRPNARKWILREATRDVLPEEVRTRSTKGGIDARILWSLQREQKRIDGLLRDPLLAQLGCIDAQALRAAVDNARRGVPVHNVHLFSALSLETWLAVHAGRWTAMPELAAASAA